MTDGGDNSGRDPRGRFGPGNPGGPGNPLAQQAANMRQAAMDAIRPEHVAAIMRKVAKKALEGDLKAARIIFDRVLGRPKEEAEDATAIEIEMPELGNAQQCAEAASKVLAALCAGQMRQGVARVLLEAIEARARTLELVELSERVLRIEQAQGNRKRRRR